MGVTLPHEWPARARHALAIIVLLAFVAGSASVLAAGHQQTQLDVTVTNFTAENTTEVHGHEKITQLSVTLHNREPTTREVGLWVHSWRQHDYAYWQPVDANTTTLAPGERVRVTVVAPVPDEGVRPDTQVAVTVMTLDGTHRTTETFDLYRTPEGDS